MSYTFKPAIREAVGLLIGLMGPSGAGKSFSAMRIASGIVGPGNRFAVIDTESRRALHYADKFDFDYVELPPPFRPDNYAEAIKAADKAGYKAIVVDSASHEWSGEGGVLDWQENELTRMAGDDWKKREACKMAAWIKPKMSHKQMVQKLLQVRSHLILCFRAEEKMKMEKNDKGKMEPVPIGWQPICSKELPYELTVSFMLSSDNPGIGLPIKLQEQHKPMFPNGKLLDEEAGKRISEWAKGGKFESPTVGTITAEQVNQIREIMKGKGITTKATVLADLSTFYGHPIPDVSMLTDKQAVIFINANSSVECPDEPGTFFQRDHCATRCGKFEGCPAWTV